MNKLFEIPTQINVLKLPYVYSWKDDTRDSYYENEQYIFGLRTNYGASVHYVLTPAMIKAGISLTPDGILTSPFQLDVDAETADGFDLKAIYHGHLYEGSITSAFDITLHLVTGED